MTRPAPSPPTAVILQLPTPHALSDRRLAGMTADDLFPFGHFIAERIGGETGRRAAALWVRAVAWHPKAAPFSQAALMSGMTNLPHEPAREALALSVSRWLLPEIAGSWEGHALDPAAQRERWVAVRLAYPGIESADLQGHVTDLIFQGLPWEAAFMDALGERLGTKPLPTFLLELFRRWRPDRTDIRLVLPALSWLGEDDLPQTDEEWEACRAAVRTGTRTG